MKFFQKERGKARTGKAQPPAVGRAGGGCPEGAATSKAVFQNGAMASVLTALVLVAVILVNLMLGKLPSKYTSGT